MQQKSRFALGRVIKTFLIVIVSVIVLATILPLVLAKVIASTGLPSFMDFSDVQFLIEVFILIFATFLGIKVYKDLAKDSDKKEVQASSGAKRTDASNEETASNSANELEREVETVFQTEKGIVIRLQDGRVVASVDGAYKLFNSLPEYRRVSKDDGHWIEISDIATKRSLLAKTAPIIEGLIRC